MDRRGRGSPSPSRSRGTLAAEQARADSALEAELARVLEQEWALRGTLREAWNAWSVVRLRAEETEALVARLESIVASTRQLAATGEISRPEAGLFEIELISRRMDTRRLQGDALEHEQRLRTLTGLTPDAPVTFIPRVTVTEVAVSRTDAQARTAQSNLTLARLHAEYEVAERTLNREIRKQYPDLTIGPTYQYEEGQSRVGFAGGLPLPIFNANVRGIAEAEAQRTVARRGLRDSVRTDDRASGPRLHSARHAAGAARRGGDDARSARRSPGRRRAAACSPSVRTTGSCSSRASWARTPSRCGSSTSGRTKHGPRTTSPSTSVPRRERRLIFTRQRHEPVHEPFVVHRDRDALCVYLE